MRTLKLAILFNALLPGWGEEVIGQSREFTVYENGLIYSPATMKQLGHIVDSLNLRFKTCDLHKTYLAKEQAKAHYVYIPGVKRWEVRELMDKGISFEELVRLYAPETVHKDLLVIKDKYTNYSNEEVVEFSCISPARDRDHEISVKNDPSAYTREMKGKWVYDWYEKSNESTENVYAFYFITGFESKPLHPDYARMVQYTECMVDTNTTIFLEDSKSQDLLSYEENENVKTFMKLVDIEFSGEPEEPEYPERKDKHLLDEYKKKSLQYDRDYRRWDSLRLVHIDKKIATKPGFKEALNKAIASALEKGGSNDLFEYYVARYASKDTALLLKRKRIVYGFCSQDQSPRYHALNIAMLSAETVNWEVFLRAHLDIMNDRFQRMSDGSYAWARRNTYIKELEELQINVPELLLGISLRVDNPSKNHYYGSIRRIGRALSETKDQAGIEKRMLDMISDEKLDDYNRMLIYYLFLNYNSYLADDRRKENKEKLVAAAKKLPEYLASQVENQD
jgi:hypothetical protein